MTAVMLRTHDGRPLPVDYEHDWTRGATVYRTKHGGFRLRPPDVRYSHDDGSAIEVEYGIGDPVRRYHYEPRPDPPVFFGITICGGTIVHPDGMDAARGGLWVNARRFTDDFRTTSVPDGTRHRVADVVWALVHHWRDLPEYLDLLHAFEVWKAPGRLGELQHRVGERRVQIEKDTAELHEWMRLADIQAALAAERQAS